MKKIISLIILSLIFVSCSEKKAEMKAEAPAKEEMKVAEVKIDEAVMKNGLAVYNKTCFACHQSTGLGLPPAFPPLAKSDYLMADRERAIKQVIQGSSGEIVVNGKTYNGVMPPQMINEQEIADVLTYVMNSWGNKAAQVTLDEVKKIKASLK